MIHHKSRSLFDVLFYHSFEFEKDFFEFHLLQVAWVFLASFSLYMFLALIPAMHSAYHLPLLVINGVIFGLHYAR